MEFRNAMKVSSEIQLKRVELMHLAEMHGINGEETVRTSQELDILINEYLILQNHSENIKGIKTSPKTTTRV